MSYLSSRPSIFVLLAEDNLHTTLRRAIRFILKLSLSRRNNTLLRYLECHQSELQLVIEILIESTFLNVHKSSFTEHFFNLERCASSSRLSSIWSRLVQLCVLPYLSDRMESYYTNLVDRIGMLEKIGQLDEAELGKLDKMVFANYENMQRLLNSVQIGFWIAYVSSASSASRSHSLSLWCFGDSIRLRTSTTVQDETSCAYRLSEVIRTLLMSFTFMVQFVQYWYTQADVRQVLSFSQSSKIAAPVGTSCDNLPSQCCPLCLVRPIVRPTALSCSGYVFCHACIRQYVTHHGRCPITLFPCSSDHLITLYDQ